ncbi:hypothetical protein BC834DRAFT_818381 [Gloeopeniophorella convolvens]|nr:hypothetical protein BC834DRAFT_818381 [Gloeopeniophorella convolvens]
MESHRDLLPNPPTGSADPSASLPALWGYIQPALDHILRAPAPDDSANADVPAKAPAVDVSYHMGIHTAIYNYFTAAGTATKPESPFDWTTPPAPPPGYDVYERLDAYFADAARELLAGAPRADQDQDQDQDQAHDPALVRYLVARFARYTAGAQAVHRLLNYVNRQYVKRAVDEDRGWLRADDVAGELPGGGGAVAHARAAEKMRERRAAELRRWGAEACAEAGSAHGRVVPLLSLAHRRFRTEVLEPLLAVPRGGPRGGEGAGPRGRLARVVKALLEDGGGVGDARERDALACGVAEMLRRTGVRPDHPLRRRLEKHGACA